MLWRERLRAGHAIFNWRVGGAFATAVIELASLLIALISLTLLIRRMREARRATIEGGGRVA